MRLQLVDRVRSFGLVAVVATTFATGLVDHDLARRAAGVDRLLVLEVPVVLGQVVERDVVDAVGAQVVLDLEDLADVLLVRLERHGYVGQRRRQDLFRLDTFVLAEQLARRLQLSDLHVQVELPQRLMRSSVSCCSIDQ